MITLSIIALIICMSVTAWALIEDSKSLHKDTVIEAYILAISSGQYPDIIQAAMAANEIIERMGWEVENVDGEQPVDVGGDARELEA